MTGCCCSEWDSCSMPISPNSSYLLSFMHEIESQVLGGPMPFSPLSPKTSLGRLLEVRRLAKSSQVSKYHSAIQPPSLSLERNHSPPHSHKLQYAPSSATAASRGCRIRVCCHCHHRFYYEEKLLNMLMT